MLKLDALHLSEVEIVRMVIGQFAGDGVFDIREAQRQIDDYVRKKHLAYRSEAVRKENRKEYTNHRKQATKVQKDVADALRQAPNCPECGAKMVIEPKIISDSVEFVFNCKYGCKYSEYVGNEQQFKKRMGIK